MIEHKESKTRDIPLWLTALVILLCIGGGAWLVKWYMQAQPRQVVEIPDDKVQAKPAANGWRGAFNNGNNGSGFTRNNGIRNQRDINANGVQPWGANSFRIKTGDTVMTVNYSGDKFDISPRYLNVQKVEGAELVMMRLGILTNADLREYLKVTEDQLAKLRAVPLPRSETLDKSDKQELSELWKAYHSADGSAKAAAEKKLLAAVDEIGKKNRAATVAFEVNRAEMVRAAVTPEQIKLYQASGGNVPAKKEPAPSTPTLLVPTKSEPKPETKPQLEKTSNDRLNEKPVTREAVISKPLLSSELKAPVTNKDAKSPTDTPAPAATK
jgi:hypothetical protein